jgi:hypothetical protein
MRFDLLSSHLDVIGNLHHASAVHWRFSAKLSFSYLHTGSLEIALYALFTQFLLENILLHSSDVEF